MKRLKNAKDEDNCCAEAETEAEAGEGEDKKGEKGLMVIMEDNCNHRCAVVGKIKKVVVVIRMWRMFMMIKNDEDDQNNEHDEYDDELQETVRTLLEMWKKIETVHFFDLYKCHQNFLKLSRIASLSCFLTIEQQ